MSHTFRTTLALSASGVMLAAAALTMAASPASATTPNAPTSVSVTVVSVNSVNVNFIGDGQAGATFMATCTSSASGALPTVTGSSSPLLVTGITNLPSQTMTCQVDETVGGLTSPCSAPASVNMTGMSGPGCVAALTAPTDLSVACWRDVRDRELGARHFQSAGLHPGICGHAIRIGYATRGPRSLHDDSDLRSDRRRVGDVHGRCRQRRRCGSGVGADEPDHHWRAGGAERDFGVEGRP